MANVKHGDCRKNRTKLYRTWLGMKKRCYQETNIRYENYGGRGIIVCNEWMNDYLAFKDWALQNGFDETKTRKQQQLDRIDNDGPYAPWNCRFANAKEQAENRRERKRVHVIQMTLNGEIIREFVSLREATDTMNAHMQNISKACRDGTRSLGFRWKYGQ
jgi:hypothetical protein